MHDDLKEGGLLSPHDAAAYTFENCSFPNSPAKLEGNCLLLCARGSRFDFAVSGNFLSAFPPIDSLLSPPDPAVSLHLSPSSNPKCNQLDETNPLPRRDNSPLIKASAFNLVMDSAALFSFANASPPRYSPVCKAYRSPLGIINKSESVERKNTKSPLPTFQSRRQIID